jgi:glutaredoxin
MANEFLSQAGIAFTAYDVSTDAAAQERLRQLSGRASLPVITVDDAVVIGSQKAKLQELLGIT